MSSPLAPNIELLIDGYLDQSLSPNESTTLGHWLKADPANAQQFAKTVLLHDRLRSEVLTMAAMSQVSDPVLIKSPLPDVRRRYGPFASVASIAVVTLAAFFVFWNFAGETPASAAVAELHRIISVSAESTDRTYQITVEDEVLTRPRGSRPPPLDHGGPPPDRFGPPLDRNRPPHDPFGPPPDRRRPPPGHWPPPPDHDRHPPQHGRGPQDHGRPPPPDRARPPKPPMNGALLHVRGGRQFVLVRMSRDERQFFTGSNGQTSWSVRPEGPVRVSSDLARFSHDLPGHEHSIPLINMQEGLEGLLDAYDVELKPIEKSQDAAGQDGNVDQLLIAVKKSTSHRGPRRVEITYAVRSGHIHQMRFVDMPYSQDRRLTLLMTLVGERNLGDDFFNHESHHAPERAVEFE